MQLRAVQALLVLAVVLCGSQPASATLLDGQSVLYEYLFPDTSTLFYSPGLVLVGPGVEIPDLCGGSCSGITADLSDTNILVDLATASGSIFAVSSFNGFRIFDSLGTVPAFTSVTINLATNLVGFDASRVSFDADNIYLNFQGLSVGAGNFVSVDIEAVPEPTTLALLGAGLVALRARRRRNA
jgi:hypothetical protein